jgi:hypothetical protein
MSDEYILDEIPEELVKKYSLDNPGVTVGWGGKRYPRTKLNRTPFTNYEIVESEGRYYVKMPKSYAPKDGG